MLTELTKQVLDYQRLLTSKEMYDTSRRNVLYRTLCDACRLIFYTYPVKVKVLQEEDAIELMLSMENRLAHLIETFRYERISFELYVKKIAYMQAHVLKRNHGREHRRYNSMFRTIDELDEQRVSDQNVLYDGMFAHPIPSLREDFWSDDSAAYRQLKQKVQSNFHFRNRMLHIILLAADELSAEQVAFLARFMEMEELELADILVETHELSAHKRERTRLLTSIKNNHYHNRRFLRQELQMLEAIKADPMKIERIRRRLKREDHLFERSVQELRRRPNPVTHSVVARQVGIPKGTIDSGLHTIRLSIARIMDGSA